MKVKMGAKQSGKIVAAQAYLAFEAGGFPGSLVGAGTQTIFAPYDIENMLVDGYDVLVNKPKVAPYRAPAAPNAAFAGEQVVDELAHETKPRPNRISADECLQGRHAPRGWPHFPGHR